MSKRRRFFIVSGWISLVANALAIFGFLIDRWPLCAWQPNQGFWVVVSFVTASYSLVTWSVWTWGRTMGEDSQSSEDRARAGIFLLNAMGVLPCLTVWLYLVLSALNDPTITSTMRWILALAIAWAGTPFIAMGLTWAGMTLGPLLERHTN